MNQAMQTLLSLYSLHWSPEHGWFSGFDLISRKADKFLPGVQVEMPFP
jgi:hypothetical protein